MKRIVSIYLLTLALMAGSYNNRTSETRETIAVEAPENPAAPAQKPSAASRPDHQPPAGTGTGASEKKILKTQKKAQAAEKRQVNRLIASEHKKRMQAKAAALKAGPISEPVAAPETPASLTLHSVFKHFEKAPQLFTISSGSDTTLTCQEGTTLHIPACAFLSEVTGLPVSGPVQLLVREYYQLSDMVLANLSTTSGKSSLETGGMIHLAAEANGEVCGLKPGQEIGIGFPFATRKPGMKLFAGQWKQNILDWQLTKNPEEGRRDPRTWNAGLNPNSGIMERKQPDVLPAFKGGEAALQKYFAENMRYPLSALEEGTEGTVELKLLIARNGNVAAIRVIKGLSPALDKVAARMAYEMPNWKPARAGKKVMAAYQTVTIPFTLPEAGTNRKTIAKARKFERSFKKARVHYGDFRDPETYLETFVKTNDKKFKAEFEKNTTDQTLKKAGVQNVSQYFFSTSGLGWINCDRFIQTNKPKIDFVIGNLGETDSMSVKVIFHSARAIMPGLFFKNNYQVSAVPLGEKVTIVAFKTQGDQLLLAVKETTIKTDGEAGMIFEPVSMARLQTEMVKLNKIKN